MRQTSVHKKLNRIAVDREAFIYLTGLQRKQRGCKPLSEESQDRVWNRRQKTSDGYAILDDESLGGGDGTYYGRWTSWRCDDLKNLLKEAGYTWKDLPQVEFDSIEVSI